MFAMKYVNKSKSPMFKKCEILFISSYFSFLSEKKKKSYDLGTLSPHFFKTFRLLPAHNSCLRHIGCHY